MQRNRAAFGASAHFRTWNSSIPTPLFLLLMPELHQRALPRNWLDWMASSSARSRSQYRRVVAAKLECRNYFVTCRRTTRRRERNLTATCGSRRIWPISAWERIDTPLARSLLRGRSLPSDLSNAIIPHFVIGSGNFYESAVNLVNPGPVGSAFELRAFDDRGNNLGEIVQMRWLTPTNCWRCKTMFKWRS